MILTSIAYKMSETEQTTTWLETDLETDDLLTFALLQPVNYIVVGEGNANIKYNRMLKYLELFPNNDACIVTEGSNSELEFEKDGHEFHDLRHKNCTHYYLTAFHDFATKPGKKIMFSCKPLRELLSLYLEERHYISQLVSNIDLYVYGGFNFRALKDNQDLKSLLKSFKTVHICESFHAIGLNNSFNQTTAPDLYNYLTNCKHSFVEIFMRAMYYWNVHMLQVAENQVNNSDKAKSERSLKIYNNIKNNIYFQVLVADFLLPFAYARREYFVNVSDFEINEFTTFTETNQQTNMYMLKGINKLDIEKWLVEELQKILV
jgi:hypothetical protein